MHPIPFVLPGMLLQYLALNPLFLLKNHVFAQDYQAVLRLQYINSLV